MNKIIRYLKDVNAELKKVSWLARSEAIRTTLIVIVSTVIISAIIGFVDYVLTKLIGLILRG